MHMGVFGVMQDRRSGVLHAVRYSLQLYHVLRTRLPNTEYWVLSY